MGKVTLPMSELYLQKRVCVCVCVCVCVRCHAWLFADTRSKIIGKTSWEHTGVSLQDIVHKWFEVHQFLMLQQWHLSGWLTVRTYHPLPKKSNLFLETESCEGHAYGLLQPFLGTTEIHNSPRACLRYKALWQHFFPQLAVIATMTVTEFFFPREKKLIYGQQRTFGYQVHLFAHQMIMKWFIWQALS